MSHEPAINIFFCHTLLKGIKSLRTMQPPELISDKEYYFCLDGRRSFRIYDFLCEWSKLPPEILEINP